VTNRERAAHQRRCDQIQLLREEFPVQWFVNDARVDLGFLPSFMSEADPLPAAKQIDRAYQHGGGWKPFQGFTFNPETKALSYPGDPDQFPVALSHLRDQTLYFYPHAWLLILEADGTWEVARVD
jgi:hypothetical protein